MKKLALTQIEIIILMDFYGRLEIQSLRQKALNIPLQRVEEIKLNFGGNILMAQMFIYAIIYLLIKQRFQVPKHLKNQKLKK